VLEFKAFRCPIPRDVMSIRRNFSFGLANSIWTALIGLLVVPLYLKYLGVESYGLIGFFVTMQALLLLLDMGLASAINRETAKYSAAGNMAGAGKLLHTLAVVYWSMAGMIALLIMAFAPLIANSWLQSKHLTTQEITHSVMLMGWVVACRWPIGLYQGALIGAQHLAVSSIVNIAMVTLGSLGAVAVLAFVSPTIEAFFIWQACVNFIYAVTMRWAAWHKIGRTTGVRFDIGLLKNVWRFSAGMSGIALLGLLLNQIDKILLSKIISLEAFAHYMLATLLVSGLFVIVTPTFNTIYPRFTALVAAGEIAKLTDLYRVGTRALATILFPAAMLIAVFAEDLVRIWTGNPDLASHVAPILSLLVIGSAIQGIMYFPYALQLAYGKTSLPLIICTVMVIAMVPLTVFLAWNYQAQGGAMAWLAVNVLYLFLGTWLTHRQLLKDIPSKWLSRDVGIPLMLSIIGGLAGHYGIQEMACPVYLQLIYGGILASTVCLLSVFISPELRKMATGRFGRKSGFGN
jgi:O-antigen/teichoic acid export membrane protein